MDSLVAYASNDVTDYPLLMSVVDASVMHASFCGLHREKATFTYRRTASRIGTEVAFCDWP